jgi:hypothetical protein
MYFALRADTARSIAHKRRPTARIAVAVCEVHLGRTVDLDAGPPPAPWQVPGTAAEAWQEEGRFDSAPALHAAAYGLRPFDEVCVRDPAAVRVVAWET